MHTESTRIEIENSLAGLDRLTKAFTEFAELHSIPAATRRDMCLVLDEIVSNKIRYGYHDKKVHQIVVELQLQEDALKVEIVDDADPFNLLEADAPKTEVPLEERKVGGLGNYLVRQLMDELAYERRDGQNHLVLHKNFSNGNDQPEAEGP